MAMLHLPPVTLLTMRTMPMRCMPAVSLHALQHTQVCHGVQEEVGGHAHAANATVSGSPPLHLLLCPVTYGAVF